MLGHAKEASAMALKLKLQKDILYWYGWTSKGSSTI